MFEEVFSTNLPGRETVHRQVDSLASESIVQQQTHWIEDDVALVLAVVVGLLLVENLRLLQHEVEGRGNTGNDHKEMAMM